MSIRNPKGRTRLIIFKREEGGMRSVFDLLEMHGHLRFSECKRVLTSFNEHNPVLHLNWRETFRQMRAGELAFKIEYLA